MIPAARGYGGSGRPGGRPDDVTEVPVREQARHDPAATAAQPSPTLVRLVLFDRDGTLVHDVPYNGDPAKVRPLGDAVDAVTRLRSAGLRTGVVTNQSGIAKGLITAADELAVRARVVELFGPFDTWQTCPHDAGDGCACRKPAPGMVLAACAATGIPPEQTVVIGDIGADVRAAGAAGARSVLVPTTATLAEEISGAEVRAATLREAADTVLTWAAP
ncbi:MAG: HAD family hydrolase [Kineosporiaceae bacterium]